MPVRCAQTAVDGSIQFAMMVIGARYAVPPPLVSLGASADASPTHSSAAQPLRTSSRFPCVRVIESTAPFHYPPIAGPASSQCYLSQL